MSLLHDYCPDDGSELHEETDGWLRKRHCPDCGERYYQGAITRWLWRLHPRARSVATTGIAGLFDRERTTPGLSLLRTGLLATLCLGVSTTIVGPIAALVVGVLGLEVMQIFVDPDQRTGRRVGPGDLILGVAWLAVYRDLVRAEAHNLLTSLPAGIDDVTAAVQAVPLAEAVGLLAAFALAYHVAYTLAIPIHERLHQLAFRAIGVDSRLSYTYHRLGGYPVGIAAGVTIPQPSAWTGTEWEQAAVSLAPLAMLGPPLLVTQLVHVDLQALPGPVAGAVIGASMAWTMAALPSPGDLWNLGTGPYTDAAERDLDAHRTAEGYQLDRI